jgi:hypothetical protein
MRRSRAKLSFAQVVRTVEVETITMKEGTGDDFRFRIEVIRRGKNRFEPRVWRIEHYRIRPTFPTSAGEIDNRERLADEMLLVVDTVMGQGVWASRPNRVIDKVLTQIADKFGYAE